MTDKSHSGGCQCGAVRFRVQGTPQRASVCYCRMCQKASASFAFALLDTRGFQVEWTRGAMSWFQSSNVVRRGFCQACGTPLAYEADGLALSVLAFDEPHLFTPQKAYGLEGKLDFCDAVPTLSGCKTLDEPEAQKFFANMVSFQHPDYDTPDWPPPPSAER